MFRTIALEPGLSLIHVSTAVSSTIQFGSWISLVDGGGERLLIDTGFAHARRAVLAALAPAPPAKLAITHAHEDHFGNAAAIVAPCPAP